MKDIDENDESIYEDFAYISAKLLRMIRGKKPDRKTGINVQSEFSNKIDSESVFDMGL